MNLNHQPPRQLAALKFIKTLLLSKVRKRIVYQNKVVEDFLEVLCQAYIH